MFALVMEAWIGGNIGLAAYFQSWLPIIAIPIGILVWVIGMGVRAHLIPTDEQKLKANRKSALWCALATAACSAAAYFLFSP